MGTENNGHNNREGGLLWPVERIERLKKYWTEGKYSASIIASLFGLTRNAVIGKAHRLGLAQKKQPTKRKTPQPPPPRRFLAIPQPPQPLPPVDMPELPFLNRTIEELERGECRFPRGEGSPYLFCGQSVRDGSSYCSYHHRLSYHPVSPQRRTGNDLAKWRGVA